MYQSQGLFQDVSFQMRTKMGYPAMLTRFLAGVTVFLDGNNNGLFDQGERRTQSFCCRWLLRVS